VADVLRAEIKSGKREVGSRLPSYRELMAEHGIALNTAQATIQLLEQDGLVVRRDRRRAYVAEPLPITSPEVQLRELRDDLGSLRDEVQQAGAAFVHFEQRLTAIVDRLTAASRN
jgi:DNA-binding GntR family transcriptional regulator